MGIEKKFSSAPLAEIKNVFFASENGMESRKPRKFQNETNCQTKKRRYYEV